MVESGGCRRAKVAPAFLPGFEPLGKRRISSAEGGRGGAWFRSLWSGVSGGGSPTSSRTVSSSSRAAVAKCPNCRVRMRRSQANPVPKDGPPKVEAKAEATPSPPPPPPPSHRREGASTLNPQATPPAAP